MSFTRLTVLLLSNLRSAIHNELERFFGQLQDGTPVSDSAFCQARHKLLPSAFIELQQECTQAFYAAGAAARWRGRRLLAIDGSTLRLTGVDEACLNYFDPKAIEEKRCGLARVSMCYDVLNHLPVDATVAPYEVDERTLAMGHLEHCGPEDLLLLDQGYPCFWLMRLMEDRGLKFCMRVSVKSWHKSLEPLLEGSELEGPLTLKPDARIRRECLDLGISQEPLELRGVKVQLPTGELEVLLTNLADPAQCPAEEFGELYPKRWPAEEGYKFGKSRLEIERWSGKSQTAIEQDFHAGMLLTTLSGILAVEAQPLVQEATAKREHRYQVNQTRALAQLRAQIVVLLLGARIQEAMDSLIATIAKSPCVIRPGRKFPRRFSPARGRFAMAYKPIA